ncbi:hypothetical protein PIB30_046418 [Stylosanthes scabra]|uniref:Uncharacterized protein n=1 Tax=Stylosanthes scabra TaxID=79078 RepID=A0ABU6UFS2_9FABA|nr:hypothetical protein [Stylosanthes scabra]
MNLESLREGEGYQTSARPPVSLGKRRSDETSIPKLESSRGKQQRFGVNTIGFAPSPVSHYVTSSIEIP